MGPSLIRQQREIGLKPLMLLASVSDIRVRYVNSCGAT